MWCKSRQKHWFVPYLLVAAIGVVMYWRGGSVEHAEAQFTKPAATDELKGLSLAYIPRDALFVFGARPSTMASKPPMSAVSKQIEAMVRDELSLGFSPHEVSELVLGAFSLERLGVVAMVRTTDDAVITKYLQAKANDLVTESFDGKDFQRSTSNLCYLQIDRRTLLIASDVASFRRSLAAGPGGASTSKWSAQWSVFSRSDAVCVVNTSLLRALDMNYFGGFPSRTNMRTPGVPTGDAMFRLMPLWQKSEFAAAELRISDKFDLRILCQSATSEEASSVQSAVLTGLPMIRMGLSVVKDSLVRQASLSDAVILKNLDILDAVVEQAQVVRRDTQVGVSASADEETTSKLIAMATPTLGAARINAQRSSSQNNLRAIGLAFHNYHDTYKAFPSAVQIGPKNIPHSWRITILPFLDSGRPPRSNLKLYQDYRQDEPWDSEHNRGLLSKMPDAYRCPLDRANSTNASYFAVLGKDTALGNERGARIADIVDGTSNTILIVESKRETPWSKPEEIPFVSDGDLPRIGGWYPGGFNAVMCDGASIFFPDAYPPEDLRNAIIRHDGRPITLPGR